MCPRSRIEANARSVQVATHTMRYRTHWARFCPCVAPRRQPGTVRLAPTKRSISKSARRRISKYILEMFGIRVYIVNLLMDTSSQTLESLMRRLMMESDRMSNGHTHNVAPEGLDGQSSPMTRFARRDVVASRSPHVKHAAMPNAPCFK